MHSIVARPIAITAVIPQSEIDAIVGLENQIRSLQAMRDQRCSELIHRLVRGCAVEPGSHSAELRELAKGPTLEVHLLIDGREVA